MCVCGEQGEMGVREHNVVEEEVLNRQVIELGNGAAFDTLIF